MGRSTQVEGSTCPYCSAGSNVWTLPEMGPDRVSCMGCGHTWTHTALDKIAEALEADG